jgi:hypothetical protein
MDEPAQHIPPLDTQAIGGLVGWVRLWVRRPEIETAVGRFTLYLHENPD